VTRMTPIPLEECPDPDLRATLEHFTTTLGFVPNRLLTMQRVGDRASRGAVESGGVRSRWSYRRRVQTLDRPHGELRRGVHVLQGAYSGERDAAGY
jgi:hypothetical protein